MIHGTHAAKKLLSLFLLSFFVLSFSGCNSEKEQASPEQPSDNVKKEEEINLFEYEFSFAVLTDVETFFLPEKYSSAYGDKILSRYDETGKKFNADINVFSYNSLAAITESIKTAAAVSEKYADLMDVNASAVFNGVDYFMPLDAIDNFDISSDKWGPKQYLETLLLNGNHYGFTAYYWGMPYPQYIGNLFFRQSVVCDEFGLVNPQELYENGEWKWDNFTEYTSALTVTDNTDAANNRYGFVISGEMKAPRAFIISNGGNPVIYDSSTGLYAHGLSDPKAVAALDYLNGLVKNGTAYFTADAWEVAFEMFKEKKTAFYEAFNKQAFVTNRLATLGEPYAWLPYPCGPEGTYGASTAQFWNTARFLAITSMASSDETENNLLLINDIFEPLDGETKDSWKEVVYTNFFFDDLSFKYYIDLYEGGHTDYSVQCSASLFTYMPQIYTSIFSGSKTVNEAVAQYDSQIKADIDKNLNNIDN